jgi:serine/threonine-protein kinase
MSADSQENFEVFGEYVLLKQLAAGGMAEVFLARPTNPNANGRIVVVKRILKQIANDPVFIKMFRSEIRVTLGFNHPHTIQLHDFGEVDYQPYIAMEFIEGKSLKQIMEKFAEKSEVIPVPTVLGLLAQAASGLSYAHHFENTATGEVVNAVHRDISPHNLLVSYDGNLKVIDFGIAKAKNEIADKTRAGQIKGKCAYLSPEQLKEEALDGRSDVFSLGIVAWEMLTGHRLFHKQGDTELQVIQRIQNCEQHIVAPSVVNSEVPKEVDELILKALAKDRDDRFATAEAFQGAIRRVMRALYPTYTYADTAQIMRALFESDMLLERMALRDANDRAQELLAAELNAKTRVVDTAKSKGFFSIFRKKTKTLPTEMELRVGNIEEVLKQKAKTSHVMVGAFWVMAFICIRLDEKYSLLDRFFLPAEAESFAMRDTQTPSQPRRMRQRAIEPRAEIADAVAVSDAETAAVETPSADGALEAAAANVNALQRPAPVAPSTYQASVPRKVAPAVRPAAPARALAAPSAKAKAGSRYAAPTATKTAIAKPKSSASAKRAPASSSSKNRNSKSTTRR